MCLNWYDPKLLKKVAGFRLTHVSSLGFTTLSADKGSFVVSYFGLFLRLLHGLLQEANSTPRIRSLIIALRIWGGESTRKYIYIYILIPIQAKVKTLPGGNNEEGTDSLFLFHLLPSIVPFLLYF